MPDTLPIASEESSFAFAQRVRANQSRLAAALQTWYDFIICGSGSSGSVVVRRLAENPHVRVLLLEAGGTDDIPQVMDPQQWVTNLGSERDWGYQAEPSSYVNGRRVPLTMGKTLGGGSSINVMVWARGHKNDWDFFAEESGDPAWSYESVLDIYRRIETYEGAPDIARRGLAGPMYVRNTSTLHPLNAAVLEAGQAVGIPRFDSPNGSMMEAAEGCSSTDLIIREGRRQSVFRSYVYPVMDRPNLTVLTGALVTSILFAGKKATGVEFAYEGKTRRIMAASEVVLSLGALNTPKLLMQSGIGDSDELGKFGIPIVEHLPGVGRNLQDHPSFGRVFQLPEPLLSGATFLGEAVVFGKSESGMATPDFAIFPLLVPFTSPENQERFHPSPNSWTLSSILLHPKSRGEVHLTGANPLDPLRIEANFLSNAEDMKAALAIMAICREIGMTDALKPFVTREAMPDDLGEDDLKDFIRNDCTNYRHQTCTAKMGRDAQSVVNAQLQVYGIDNLRIADGSILPRVTTGNTMAPCVVIGERAGEMIKKAYQL
ncbi:Choline dehydrogenase [Acidisarcina polymorpha]|uniref:Choline dehydrogenase n=1 Tax=Acidisarcina polymorpha TaxID=2211140 RepID=A0A2Z5FSY2_9BACT|nr:GMC family oxidoreductase N-terminal domain-containing protein [Acidisarcina polymorpha]AXC09938.1 Choline dehydrogenase [Acidisarcina polymorpha]